MIIHDTLGGSGRELDLSRPVRMYLCGVTVYDSAHIGHARTIVVFDVLRRHLEGRGADVRLVQNFTDVDDKILERAAREGVDPADLAQRYVDEYFEDFDELNVLRASAYPRATENIGGIISLIGRLVGAGAAYVSRNGVYFAVSSFPGYGRLSKKKTGQLRAGARVGVDDTKRDPLDFALWKFSDVARSWESPWGRGRPGWHIECSAMCMRYLGESFEVHGGGRDLIFPHHENEIAQSEACTGVTPAAVWMHVGMVTVDGEKMSKSLGNTKSVRHVLERWGPNVVRLFCLSGHYAKPVDYSEGLLSESVALWRQAEACFYELAQARGGGEDAGPELGRLSAEFDAALDEDLNTHLALSSYFGVVREANRLAAARRLGSGTAGLFAREFARMSGVLGLRVAEPGDGEKRAIEDLVRERERLRGEGRFGEADAVREKLGGMGVELVDRGGHTAWIRRERIAGEGAA